MRLNHPMGPACVGYTPGPPENQIPPYVGQDGLFGVLGHIDLIRNILPMWWNMEVQPTSNYSLQMALQVYVKLGHVDLIGDLAVRDYK